MLINDLLNIESNYNKEEKKIILSFLLNCKKNDIYLVEKIEKKVVKKYKKMLRSNLPVQYLLKNVSFLNNDFFVNEDVLIPRFETEELVIYTNKLIKDSIKENVRIIDIGTGSGAIAISLKKLDEDYEIVATDISKKALKVAEKNAKLLNCDITFIRSDMLSNVTGKYDVLISNPPYIDVDDKNIEDKVLKYEPHLALFAKNKGLEFYEKILSKAKNILNDKSIIAFEIGYNQKKDINNLVKNYFPKAKIINKCDLNGFDRYIYILNNIE